MIDVSNPKHARLLLEAARRAFDSQQESLRSVQSQIARSQQFAVGVAAVCAAALPHAAGPLAWATGAGLVSFLLAAAVFTGGTLPQPFLAEPTLESMFDSPIEDEEAFQFWLAKAYEPAVDSVAQLISRLVRWSRLGVLLQLVGLVLFGLGAFYSLLARG